MHTANPLQLPATGFLRRSDLLGCKRRGKPRLIPMAASTLHDHVNKRLFPAPVKLSAGITAWRVEDIRAYIAGTWSAA
jgi:hypothetical protein